MSAAGGTEKNKVVLYVVIGLITLVVIVGLGFLIKMMTAKPATTTAGGTGAGSGTGTGSGSSYQPGKGWTIYQGVLQGLGGAADIFGNLSDTFNWGNRNNTNSSTSNSSPDYNPDQNDAWA